ncbi:MAG TPA: hypothetical protein VGL86_17910 [Polyangia bacterium]|jgi:hypothetical protein
MRIFLLLLATTLAAAGCRQDLGADDVMADLTALADGSVVACIAHDVTYREGEADCCKHEVTYATVRLDAAGALHDHAAAASCPDYYGLPYPVPVAGFQVTLPDGGALVFDNGKEVVQSVAADGTVDWSTTLGFSAAAPLTALGPDAVFVGASGVVHRLALTDGSITWAVSAE